MVFVFALQASRKYRPFQLVGLSKYKIIQCRSPQYILYIKKIPTPNSTLPVSVEVVIVVVKYDC